MRYLAIATVLILAGCATTAVDAPTEPTPLAFTAFQGEWSEPATMDASADAISVLAVDGLNFLPDGAGLTESTDAQRALLDHAHKNGLKAELMVGNFDATLGDFNEQLAYDTLSDDGARAAVVDELGTIVETQGWDGVSIDLESLEGRDTELLSAFSTELRTRLGSAPSISIALMVAPDAATYVTMGYDFGVLTEGIDRFVLMAYDEHGPWEDVPGPVGSLDWQRAGLESLLEGVPAEQVELGVAGYGYGWGRSGDGQLSVAKARELAPDATFDEAAGEWTATLADGTELWFSDIRSFKLRVALAKEYDLAGVALWSLEQSDAITENDLK